ncbi:glutamate--cysteine ligase [Endozoicomonas sp.]|nr:glutamate--cysteine ligase [Endozoicomonas sp.]
MTTLYQTRLELLGHSANNKLLSAIRHGIEREGLRVSDAAELSTASHPEAFGKALTHPYITTDFSEALLEYITPVHCRVDDTLAFLEELQRYTAQHFDQELLWAGSMPCGLKDVDSIPIADYGQSNIGKMKSIYREGLSNRYGKAMQAIAGLHYNFSLPESIWPLLSTDQSQGYLALIRNFMRYSWLLMYLLGGSPAVSRTFFADGGEHSGLKEFDCNTLYLPYATSLRMSDMGYSNNAQSSLNVSYNSLGDYVDSLWNAIHMPYEGYEQIGVKVDGEYRQLNANLLQIENEYYSTIRPKRIACSGEKPLTALRRDGVEYVEVRCIDINPFDGLGIAIQDARFLDIFLMYCALQESPSIGSDELKAIKTNFDKTVLEGRCPDFTLEHHGRAVRLPDVGEELLAQMLPVAQLLDSASGDNGFTQSLALQSEKLMDAGKTPSARVMAAMETSGLGYTDLMLELSKKHDTQFKSNPLSEERLRYFTQVAKRSTRDQQSIEQEDSVSFDEFLKNYELAD